mmetsp:Transcript_6916/g.17060  ORF Transcript_6916/g.17060 Transcript_6916/m.17060 type:complete len:352 (-) Transcript_6916:525-1580(-)
MAKNKCDMAPCLGSVPKSFLHLVNPLGSSSVCGISLTVSNGVAFDTTAFLALTTLPFLSRTPTARPSSIRISSTCAFSWSFPPNFSNPRWSVFPNSHVPPTGTENAAVSSKNLSRMYSRCAVMAPLAGKPQKMHMVSIKLRRNGTVTNSSTVLDRSSNVNDRSPKTSGCVRTNGREPAVVARKPASCRRFKSATAVVDPPSVRSRSRSACHSAMALGPSSPHCSISSSSNPCLLPMGKRQYPLGVQYPSPLYVLTGMVSSRMSKIILNGLSEGRSSPSKMLGPTSKLYFPPSCMRLNVWALPPTLMWLSRHSTREPYFAERAEHASPPMPDPMTMMSYSPASPDRPLPVPG